MKSPSPPADPGMISGCGPAGYFSWVAEFVALRSGTSRFAPRPEEPEDEGKEKEYRRMGAIEFEDLEEEKGAMCETVFGAKCEVHVTAGATGATGAMGDGRGSVKRGPPIESSAEPGPPGMQTVN